MKRLKDDLDFANRLVEQIRQDNKKLKDEVDGLYGDAINAKRGENAELAKRNARDDKSVDTVDLVIKRPEVDHPTAEAGGEDFFELKKRIRQLEDEIRRLKSDNDSMSRSLQNNFKDAADNGKIADSTGAAENEMASLDEELKR